MLPADGALAGGDAFVSTGRPPTDPRVEALIAESHARIRANDEGDVSSVYPALAHMPRDLFGICIVATDGRVHAAGDVDAPFALMSVAKPFVFALVSRSALRSLRSRPARRAPSAGTTFRTRARAR